VNSSRSVADNKGMSDTMLLTVSALAGLWVGLSIIGGERERTLQQLEIARRTAPPPPEAEAAATPGQTEIPVVR
jgi:hypothetical protein